MCLIASAESGLSELIVVLLTHNDIVSCVSHPVSGKFQLYFSYLRPAVAIVPSSVRFENWETESLQKIATLAWFDLAD